jgi:hypothetical protein
MGQLLGRLHVDTEPDRYPFEGLLTPSRLDENAGQLTEIGVKVVRPFETNRLRGEAVERLRGGKSNPQRQHAQA